MIRTLLLVLFLGGSAGDCNAFDGEPLSRGELLRVRELIDRFVSNTLRVESYSVVVSLTMNQFNLKSNPEQMTPVTEMVICVDHPRKYKRASYCRENIQQNVIRVNPWTSEFRRAGVRTFANRGLPEQKALPISLLPQFDPFELSIGNLFDLFKDRCDTGYALSKLDSDKAILLDQDGDLETVVFQQRPGSLLTVTFSERHGGMPIRTRITASMDRNTLTLQPKGEINYLTYETVCAWRQANGTWYPVESQVSHIGRFLKPSPTEKSRWDFEFRWYDGKEISHESIDKMDPEKLWQFVDEKANIKREKNSKVSVISK